MTSAYQKELDFMISVLQRLRLQVHLVQSGERPVHLDEGLRQALGMSSDYDTAHRIISN